MSSVVQTAFKTVATERYEALFRVSQTLMSNRDPEDLLRILAIELCRVVNFFYLGVGIYDEKAHEVRLKMFDETGVPIQPPALAPEETMTWWVYQQQQPLVIPSLDQETQFPVVVGLLKKLGIRSMCMLPLTTVHRRLGGFAVGSKETDAYSRKELCFLTLVANQVALAVDDALNFEASEAARA